MAITTDGTHEEYGEPEHEDERLEVSPVSTLAEKVQRRAQEIASERPIMLDVPGYEFLVAQYHALDYKLIRKIMRRHEKRPDKAEAELFAAVDTLVTASDDILERTDSGELRSLGYRWGVSVARELWHKDDAETARQAMLAIFSGSRDAQLVIHYGEYVDASRSITSDIEDELTGE